MLFLCNWMLHLLLKVCLWMLPDGLLVGSSFAEFVLQDFSQVLAGFSLDEFVLQELA